MSKKIMVCPECGNLRFYTTAHVMQEWEVDERGCFISVSEDCLEVTHGPDRGNTWTCSACGKEAISMTYLKEVGGLEIYYTEDYRKGSLFVAIKAGNKVVSREFFDNKSIKDAADALLRTRDVYTKEWLLENPDVINRRDVRLGSGNYFFIKEGCAVCKLPENKFY